MDVALLLKLFANRDKLERMLELVSPAFDKLKPNLPELTKLGTELGGELFPDTPAEASKALDVKWLQSSLRRLVQSNLVVDGDYGMSTRAAVAAFQRMHGLFADGWAGPDTVPAILTALTKLGPAT